jgi:hypothetical protein
MIGTKAVCTDGQLVGGALFSPDEVEQFITELTRFDIHYIDDDEAVSYDVAVVDQRIGPMCNAPWLAWGFVQLDSLQLVTAATLVGTPLQPVVCPDGWKYELSMSSEHEFIPSAEIGRLLPIASSAGVDSYIDLKKGSMFFQPTPRTPSTLIPTPMPQLSSIKSSNLKLLGFAYLDLATTAAEVQRRELLCVDCAREQALADKRSIWPVYAPKPRWWRKPVAKHTHYNMPTEKSISSLWSMYGGHRADGKLLLLFVGHLYGETAAKVVQTRYEQIRETRIAADTGWMLKSPDGPLPSRKSAISLLLDELEDSLPPYDTKCNKKK